MKNPFAAWATYSNSDHRKSGYIVQIMTKDLATLAEKTPICHYCGIKLDYTPFKGNHRECSATVDRINNETILRPDNIQIICLACNRRKNKKSHAQYLKHISKSMEIQV